MNWWLHEPTQPTISGVHPGCTPLSVGIHTLTIQLRQCLFPDTPTYYNIWPAPRRAVPYSTASECYSTRGAKNQANVPGQKARPKLSRPFFPMCTETGIVWADSHGQIRIENIDYRTHINMSLRPQLSTELDAQRLQLQVVDHH